MCLLQHFEVNHFLNFSSVIAHSSSSNEYKSHVLAALSVCGFRHTQAYREQAKAGIMGLLSDPNRRRALISMLTRLNAPIW